MMSHCFGDLFNDIPVNQIIIDQFLELRGGLEFIPIWPTILTPTSYRLVPQLGG